jgi:hypothetical protein
VHTIRNVRGSTKKQTSPAAVKPEPGTILPYFGPFIPADVIFLQFDTIIHHIVPETEVNYY